jgi:hypothetical protein
VLTKNKRLFFFDSCLTIIYNTDFVSFRYILFSYFTDFVVSFRWNSFSYFTDFVSFRWISFSYFTDFVSFRWISFLTLQISFHFVGFRFLTLQISLDFVFVLFRFSVYRYPKYCTWNQIQKYPHKNQCNSLLKFSINWGDHVNFK